MEQKKLLETLALIINEQKENRQWGTSHIYQSTANSFSLYIKGVDIPFGQLTPTLLKDYEIYLRSRRCSWNTVATYMKVLKAVYNRAVDRGDALFVPRLFKHVRTSPCTEHKKALRTEDMRLLLNGTTAAKPSARPKEGNPTMPLPAPLQSTQMYFALMFLLRGIPFVDLAYLRKTDIRDNVLTYRRRKTGRLLTVTLSAQAVRLINALAQHDSHSPYLFPFLSSPEGTEAAYHEYQLALRRFNHRLKTLAKYADKIDSLSTYSARHTWATMAYYCEIHPGIISEAMGHSSIAVTEVYLKPFQNDKIDSANQQVIAFVQG
ncbi:MAG: site-specific integrase [Bacteroides sp.]|nr:site-specific integrase [Bacteroides sp.]